MKRFVLQREHVGSRVTCDPAPVDTDDDYLVLIKPNTLYDVDGVLTSAGYKLGGSVIPDGIIKTSDTEQFFSYTHGIENIIITESWEFFRRFMAATRVATRLNLLVKADRIALFQAVLYGNG